MQFKDLEGQTLAVVLGKVGDDVIEFCTSDNRMFRMSHSQDCCEQVTVEDICGDLEWLLDSPILHAEESTNENQTPAGVPNPGESESYRWTFYRLSTINGTVVIRWYGASDYYSLAVDFEEVKGKS